MILNMNAEVDVASINSVLIRSVNVYKNAIVIENVYILIVVVMDIVLMNWCARLAKLLVIHVTITLSARINIVIEALVETSFFLNKHQLKVIFWSNFLH